MPDAIEPRHSAFIGAPAAVLSGPVCKWILLVSDLGRLRREARDASPEAVAAIDAIEAAALTCTARTSASADGSGSATAAEVAPQSTDDVDAIEAAAIAGISDSAIRQRCRKGDLIARRVNGRWWIDRGDLMRLVNKRDERVA